MEKEMLQNFSLFERIIIRVHKRLFIKYRNRIRINIVNQMLR